MHTKRIICFNLILILFLLTGQQDTRGQEYTIRETLTLADSLIGENEFNKAKPILDSITSLNVIAPSSLEADRLNAIFGYYFFNQDKYDSALIYFSQLIPKTWISEDKDFLKFIGKAINDAGIVYYRVGKLDSAEIAHDRSLVLALEENDLQLQAYNYNNLAILYKNQKKYANSMQYFQKGLEINKAIPNLEGQGYQYLNMAMLLHDQAMYTQSLENYLKSLVIFEELEEDNLRLIVYDRIGRYYHRIKDSKNAQRYFDKSYQLAVQTNNRRYIGRSLQNMGRLKSRMNQPDSARYYFRASLEIFEPMNLVKSTFDSYAEIGHSFKDQKQYAEALKMYNKALELDRYGSPSSTIAVESAKANIFNLMGEYANARKLALEALERYPEEKQTKQSLMALFGVLSNSEQALGNHASALDYYRKKNLIEDSIFNQEKQLDIARLEFEYQLEKEKELFELQAEKQALTFQSEIQKAEASRNLLIAIASIFIIAGSLIYRSYVMKRKANKLLQKNAKELEEKNNLLEVSYAKEQTLMHANLEEKERRMAAIAMNQLEKESLLQKIDDKIEHIYKANGSTQLELKALQKLVRSNINMSNSWDSFLHQFEQIHPDFFEILRKQYLSLTVNDLKVCAYVKIGMDNKSIAQVTNTTVNTIKSRIHRIKKKIDLGPEDSIRDFLMGIGQTNESISSQLNEAQVRLSGNSLAAANASS